MKCKDCKTKIGIFRNLFIRRCKKCERQYIEKLEKQRKEEERKEKIQEDKIGKKREKINKAKKKLRKFEDEDGIELQYRDLFYDDSDLGEWNKDYDKYEDTIVRHKKDKNKKYCIGIKKVFEGIIKNNFDVEKTLGKIEEEIEYKINIDKLKEKERRRKIKENAEQDFYGRIKSKRDNLSLDKREDILRKFNNKCIICDKEEGLHIHHKDNNPQNNLPENLIVLCGVCHKKAHMKVR
jgi:hypothetical protein